MAYTYQNIVDEAKKAGVLEKLTQKDHDAAQKNPEYGMALVGLLRDESNATTEEQRLITNASMEKLRKSYGVTGTSGTSTGSSFSREQRLVLPDKTGTLTSSDSTTISQVMDDILNQSRFSYDNEKDPVYQAYAKQYRREGERAVEDVMAKAAAMTGGRPSSYAISAAQQAGNQYAAALADMLPTLRSNAYTEHLQNMDAKYDVLAALQAQQETEYQRQLEEENRKRLEVQDALTKYNALGYATEDVAKILGIPAGKPTAEYTMANLYGTEGGKQWIKVGERKLTQEEFDAAQAAGKISATYDNKAGTVLYEWAEGQEPDDDTGDVTTLPGSNYLVGTAPRYKISNRTKQAEGKVLVDGTWLTYAQLAQYIKEGLVQETVYADRGEVSYKLTPKGKNNKLLTGYWSGPPAARNESERKVPNNYKIKED